VPDRPDRLSWVTWVEGKPPDVVIELLSPSTGHKDKTEKKQVYQDCLKAPEYYWFNNRNGEFAGFELVNGEYQPIKRDRKGRMYSRKLDLMLVRWTGEYEREEGRWIRWATADGVLLPTPQEVSVEAQARADEERLRADEERLRADRLAARLRALGIDPNE
jgi:hypothetical protein